MVSPTISESLLLNDTESIVILFAFATIELAKQKMNNVVNIAIARTMDVLEFELDLLFLLADTINQNGLSSNPLIL